MINIPYKLPVKVHVYNRRWTLRDPQGREIIEIALNTNSIDNWKRLTSISNFLQDLMNGSKSVSYNPQTKGYDIMNHAEAPVPGAVVGIAGTLARAEQAEMERILDQQNRSEESAISKVIEVVKDTVTNVAETVKRGRGRPRKK